jgi:hypothetical protein
MFILYILKSCLMLSPGQTFDRIPMIYRIDMILCMLPQASSILLSVRCLTLLNLFL